MTKTAHPITNIITALLLCAAIMLGGVFASQQFRASQIYLQSQIIRSIYSEPGSDELPGWTGFVTDSRSREVLFMFAGAVANAYVSFELIPHGEAATFAVIYSSLVPDIEIADFSYNRQNLTITGISDSMAGYTDFLEQLRESGHFYKVNGMHVIRGDGTIRFEIECVAHERQGLYNFIN